MMKPEPSERLSGRPGPCPGPGWRGMKRRKNSWISSSSMPGTCGTAGVAVRRADCVVLMLTTAAPCSSTRRVKSGSSRTWASAGPEATNASRTNHRLGFIRVLSLLGALGFDAVGDAPYARRGCFANHRHEVVRHFTCVDIERAEIRHPGAHELAALAQRLDEDRYRGQAVGVDHLPDDQRFAQLAAHL